MKILLWLVMLSSCLFADTAQKEEEKKAPEKKASIVIKTVGDKTFINDLEFVYGKTTLKELEAVFGKSRVVEGARKRYFQTPGVAVEMHRNGSVELINFYFSNVGSFSDKNAKGFFKGEFIFKGVKIKPNTKVDHILEKLKDKKLIDQNEKHLPTTKLERSAWWFYREMKGKNPYARKKNYGDHLQMITIWTR